MESLLGDALFPKQQIRYHKTIRFLINLSKYQNLHLQEFKNVAELKSPFLGADYLEYDSLLKLYFSLL